MPGLKLPLLVNDPAKLHQKVLPVFAKLRAMDDNPQAKTKAYREIKQQDDAAPVMMIRFESGSSELSAADEAKLKNLIGEGNQDARYLVVGYASADGDADINAELSSRRASAVAGKIVEGTKMDRAEAVYFGQTSRFSNSLSAPNRLVEVWQVK